MTCQIRPFFTFRVLIIVTELEKSQKFFTVTENIFSCFIKPNLMVIAPKTIKFSSHLCTSDPECTRSYFQCGFHVLSTIIMLIGFNDVRHFVKNPHTFLLHDKAIN